MFKRILIGLDGSAESERSLPWVRLIRGSAEVVLARFVEAPPVRRPGLEGLTPAIAGEAFPLPSIDSALYDMQVALNLLARDFSPPAKTMLRQGPGYPGLVEGAMEIGADLIAITTHGGTPLARRTVGGTTEKLLHGSNVPLLVVPPRGSAKPPPGAVRHIVVPLDGSDISESVLPLAASVAQEHEAEIVLMHVLSGDEVARRRFADIEGRLQRVAAGLALKWVRARIVVRYGDVPEAIRQTVLDERADLIVMSAHGFGAIGRMLFGSVASALVRESPLPVMVARHDALRAWASAREAQTT